jgi:hypothetical protein
LNEAVVKPPFPDPAYYLGFVYFKQGDLTAAEKWLKEAAQLNPRGTLASLISWDLCIANKGARRKRKRP